MRHALVDHENGVVRPAIAAVRNSCHASLRHGSHIYGELLTYEMFYARNGGRRFAFLQNERGFGGEHQELRFTFVN